VRVLARVQRITTTPLANQPETKLRTTAGVLPRAKHRPELSAAVAPVKAVAEERAEAEAKEKAKEKAKAKDSETGIRRELGSRPSRTIAQLIRKESADHGHSD
jgi:hypothetical protein